MGIGSIFSNVINPSSIAMLAAGPAGWATLAAQSLMSAVGQQIIQQLGDQLGVPQSMIDLAQAQFAGSMGDFQGVRTNLNEAIEGFAGPMNAGPAQTGAAQSQMNDAVNNLVADLAESREAKEAKAGGAAGAGGWLMAIATTLGRELDQMAGDLEQMAGQLSKDDPSMTAQFGALSQQFGMMFNATSTAIKAIGEAMSGMARKQ